MSRATVRVGIATYFTGTAGLKNAFARPPKVIPGDQQPALTVHVGSMTEHRTANRTKVRSYEIRLLIDYIGRKPKAEDNVTDFDALLEAIETKLRTDPTLGGVVLLAGEPSFKTTSTLPVTDKQNTVANAMVEFTADEELVGV